MKNSLKTQWNFPKTQGFCKKLKPKNSISGISKIFRYPECGQKKAAVVSYSNENFSFNLELLACLLGAKWAVLIWIKHSLFNMTPLYSHNKLTSMNAAISLRSTYYHTIYLYCTTTMKQRCPTDFIFQKKKKSVLFFAVMSWIFAIFVVVKE